jgi:transposase
MLALSNRYRYFLYRQATDMRKSFDGLSGLVSSELGQNPLSGDIFIFINKRRDRIKLLSWQQDGYALYYKRLESGTFELPTLNSTTNSVVLQKSELLLILEGISLEKAVKRPRFSLQNSAIITC